MEHPVHLYQGHVTPNTTYCIVSGQFYRLDFIAGSGDQNTSFEKFPINHSVREVSTSAPTPLRPINTSPCIKMSILFILSLDAQVQGSRVTT